MTAASRREFAFVMALLFPLAINCLFAQSAISQQPAVARKIVKVFILAGQSNMEGKASVELLQHQMMQPETEALFSHLHRDGKLIERDDVTIKFLDRSGKLTAGFGSPNKIGPELQFGFTMGDHFDEPVLLIKTAWGGKSLYRDFRPPSAGEADPEILEKQLEGAQKRKPETTMEEIKSSYGFYYREMLKEIDEALVNMDQLVPGYTNEQGYEIVGFAWFQGFNDMVTPEFVDPYTELMAHFIRDVRKDLKKPHLPFVVGVLGVGGTDEPKKNERKEQFKKNQAAVGDMPEFQGNVAIVQTDQYWDKEADAVFNKGWKDHLDEWQKIGSDRPYHYLGSVKCYNRIGGALAEALIGLIDKESTAQPAKQATTIPANFRTENLIAWCIVPFDAKNRGPAERADMVRRLGMKRVAYDWRQKNVPEFEQEILEYKKNGLEYFAFWGWHDSMEALIKQHEIKPQIWEMFRGNQPDGTEEEKVKVVAEQFLPIAQKAKALGLKFGIYNHGDWAGKPSSLIAVCEYLRTVHHLDNVGIVFNFHHGHDAVEDFESNFKMLQPYLICLNLNGTADPATVNRQTHENQILPIGSGIHEADMIDVVLKSGYQGPVGVLGHRADMDAEESVGLNLAGLKRLLNER